jgi:hypothetical protein
MLNSTIKAISLPGVPIGQVPQIIKSLPEFKDLAIAIDPALLAKHAQFQVMFDLRDVPLRVVLKNMLAPNGLEYTIVGEGIYIKEKAPVAPAEKPTEQP